MNIRFLACAAVLAAGPALAQPSAATEEAKIPFATTQGIWNFHAGSEDVLYLQDRARKWYRAELMGPCEGLTRAVALAYDTHGSATFDRFSSVLVDGRRCDIRSLVRSDKPERRKRKRGG